MHGAGRLSRQMRRALSSGQGQAFPHGQPQSPRGAGKGDTWVLDKYLNSGVQVLGWGRSAESMAAWVPWQPAMGLNLLSSLPAPGPLTPELSQVVKDSGGLGPGHSLSALMPTPWAHPVGTWAPLGCQDVSSSPASLCKAVVPKHGVASCWGWLLL